MIPLRPWPSDAARAEPHHHRHGGRSTPPCPQAPDPPRPIADPAGRRAQGAHSWRSTCLCLTLALALILPAVPQGWYARFTWEHCARQLDEAHRGTDWAIIACHAHGRDADGPDLWGSLWRHHHDEFGWGTPYHFALLVSDNQHLFLYAWSMRRDRLVLVRRWRLTERSDGASYRFIAHDRSWRHGLPWRRRSGVAVAW